jgi:hypothetical protein
MRVLVSRLAAVSALVGALLLAGCATTADIGVASQRLNQAWASDNQGTRATLGARTVRATPDQAYRAAKLALGRIGLDVDEAASRPPRVVASRLYKAGAWSWSDAVQKAEQTRMVQVFTDAIGLKAIGLVFKPGDEIIGADLTIGSASREGTLLRVNFGSRPPNGDCSDAGCITEMPPSALRAAYYEFWTAFDEELSAVEQEDALHAVPPKGRRPVGARATRVAASLPQPKPKSKAPNEWVLPPSGWTPPPR